MAGTTEDTRVREAKTLPFGPGLLYADGYKRDVYKRQFLCNEHGGDGRGDHLVRQRRRKKSGCRQYRYGSGLDVYKRQPLSSACESLPETFAKSSK